MRYFFLLTYTSVINIILEKTPKNLFMNYLLQRINFWFLNYITSRSYTTRNILVTSEGHKISINFRMSGLSMAYSKPQHSKWQLWLTDDHLSGPSPTDTISTGQRCAENLYEANVFSWMSLPLSLNSHPLFSDMDRFALNLHLFFFFLLKLSCSLTPRPWHLCSDDS